MRCNNCGYVNEDSATHCIKCDAPLGGDDSRMRTASVCSPTESGDFQPGATVCEVTSGGSHETQSQNPSSSIGRQRPEPSLSAVMSGNGTLSPNKPCESQEQGTINPWIRKSQNRICWLHKIDETGECMALKCEGDRFELTRDNTNPDDHAISSHQAILTSDADGWYIEDSSTYKTTAIVAGRRMKLEEGDIVVLGMSRFQFTEKDVDTTD